MRPSRRLCFSYEYAGRRFSGISLLPENTNTHPFSPCGQHLRNSLSVLRLYVRYDVSDTCQNKKMKAENGGSLAEKVCKHTVPPLCAGIGYMVLWIYEGTFYPMYYLLSPFSPLVVTQIRGQMAGFSPPSHYSSCLAFFLQERFHPSLSSLVDSRRIEHIYINARRSQKLFPFFREINPTYHHDRIRTPGPSLRTYRIRGVQTTVTRIEKCRFCWSWLFAVGYASTYVGITL